MWDWNLFAVLTLIWVLTQLIKCNKNQKLTRFIHVFKFQIHSSLLTLTLNSLFSTTLSFTDSNPNLQCPHGASLPTTLVKPPISAPQIVLALALSLLLHAHALTATSHANLPIVLLIHRRSPSLMVFQPITPLTWATDLNRIFILQLCYYCDDDVCKVGDAENPVVEHDI